MFFGGAFFVIYRVGGLIYPFLACKNIYLVGSTIEIFAHAIAFFSFLGLSQ
jgi:hypothetical protein